MTWRERAIFAIGMFATAYAAHSVITNLRAGRDWYASFAIAATLFCANTLVEFVLSAPVKRREP